MPTLAQLTVMLKPRYRRRITVTGVGTSLTDYTIPVTLDIRDKIPIKYPGAFAVDEAGDILPAVVDKFSWIFGTPTIWIKIPSLPANAVKTLYLYYGIMKPQLFRYSDVFLYGDDFQDPDFTLAYWSLGIYRSPTVTRSFIGSTLRISGTFPDSAYYEMYKPSISYSPGKHIQYVARATYAGSGNVHSPRFHFGHDTYPRVIYLLFAPRYWRVETWSSAEGAIGRHSVTGYFREYVLIDVYVTPSGFRHVIRTLDRAVTFMDYTFSTTPNTVLLSFGIRNYSGTTQTVDAVFYHAFMRHYVSPEPSVSVGPEEEVYRYPDTL